MERGRHPTSTINQLVRKPRQSKSKRPGLPALNKGLNSKKKQPIYLNSLQKRGVYTRVGIMTPKKSNPVLRKYARVRLLNNIEINAYTPGVSHNLQEHSIVFVCGGRVKNLPDVHYHIVRDALDISGVDGRRQGRSLYEARKPKN